MRWFRFYDEALNDPKVQRLPADLFKAWVNLLCIASRNSGALPGTEDIAFALRLPATKVAANLAALLAAGLLDSGEHLSPHNWASRQYVSDDATVRMQRYRKRRNDLGLPIVGDYNAFRAPLIARDGERCVYCGAQSQLVVDHMVPISAGGTDDEDNLALACKRCNSGKSGRTPEQAGYAVTVTTAAHAYERYRNREPQVTVQTQIQNRTDKKESPSPIGLVPQTAEALNAERPKRPSPKRIFSDDWQPSGEDRQYAAALGLDPDGEARGCKNHSIANGKPYANHSRAYRNWCDKSAEFRASSGGRGRVQRAPASIAEATAAVIAAAARAGKSAGGNGAGGYGGGPLPQPHGEPPARPNGLEIDDWGFVGGIDRVPAGCGENGAEEVGQDTEETRRSFLVAYSGGDPGGMPVAGRAPQGNAEGSEVTMKARKP